MDIERYIGVWGTRIVIDSCGGERLVDVLMRIIVENCLSIKKRSTWFAGKLST